MKNSYAFIIIILVIVSGIFLFRGKDGSTPAPNANNVKVEDGVQIVEITAKGGYLPRVSTAKAGMPTMLRINTKGTFDCSAAVRIPSMNVSKMLPQSGVTDIDLGTQEAGTLAGTCSMGMYPFEIIFES